MNPVIAQKKLHAAGDADAAKLNMDSIKKITEKGCAGKRRMIL